ncbi:NAD-dependent epimerase [Lyngbya confervoides]|uniref:NAD-dependent epimerase n=1 Tax=Lyngbya confervoides BDU141951 TaxID=1574623 RepID=A0ABD4T0J7_9CYAN|nr:NAD-dependent epimerase [Lyngbya confervoides]MCM1982171.1 NAD-dependent epimerase [Lyngbya confervoides BDU141951]
MRVLVTGAAGFIGFHLAKRLLAAGDQVVGLDNLNDYYDVDLKRARLKQLQSQPEFLFCQLDLTDRTALLDLFAQQSFDRVIHLAAQAGIRYSLINPFVYVESNVEGFINILEGCRRSQTPHLVYASSSSVYGGNTKVPFAVTDRVDQPVSLYAATKRSNELMAETYSHLYGLLITGLRFFTVYGPWGRPDMAYFKFTEAMFQGRPIEVYNHGQMKRDLTYIDDIVSGVCRVMERSRPEGERALDEPANRLHRIYNLGNHVPVPLLRLIDLIEQETGQSAQRIYLPMQPGEVLETFADISDLTQEFGFKPETSIEVGIQRFVSWYRRYYQV